MSRNRTEYAADDIVILGDLGNDVVMVTEKSIVFSHRMDIAIDENQTKNLVMT